MKIDFIYRLEKKIDCKLSCYYKSITIKMPFTRSQTAHQQESTINTQHSPSTSPSPSPSPGPITSPITNTSQTSYPLEDGSHEDVFEWEFDGIVYLKDSQGFMYDIFTGENVGYFDGEQIMDVEEDGVWVLESTKMEIIPKEEVGEYSETEMLKIRIKQLELELESKNSDIDFHLEDLSNKDRFIQQSENIRTHLLEKQDSINSKFTELVETHRIMEIEYNTLKQTVSSVIENSGDMSQETEGASSVMTYEQISQELTRKENVIRRKDAKATRLINIIREKNLELANHANKMQEMTTYQWMLSSNIKTLSDENTAWKNYYATYTTGQIPTTSTQQDYNTELESSFQDVMPMTGVEEQGHYLNNDYSTTQSY